jgi:hypothetical protein
MTSGQQSQSNTGEVYCENACDSRCEMYYLTEKTKNENDDVECETVSCSLMQIENIQGKLNTKTMIVLFNPGRTSSSYIKRSVLPVGATPALHDVERKATTLGGETMSNLSVRAQNITLPEFSKSLRVDHHVFWVHDNENVRYDAIIGRDLLRELKLDICYSDGTMKMEGRVLLMKRRGETPTFYINDEEDEDNSDAVEIKGAKYEKVKIDDVIEQQKHLSSVQRLYGLSAVNGKYQVNDSFKESLSSVWDDLQQCLLNASMTSLLSGIRFTLSYIYLPPIRIFIQPFLTCIYIMVNRE